MRKRDRYDVKGFDVDNEGVRSREEIEKLVYNCERFLVGDARAIPGFPFHGEKNTGQLTIIGVRSVLKWVLGDSHGFQGEDSTYGDLRRNDKDLQVEEEKEEAL